MPTSEWLDRVVGNENSPEDEYVREEVNLNNLLGFQADGPFAGQPVFGVDPGVEGDDSVLMGKIITQGTVLSMSTTFDVSSDEDLKRMRLMYGAAMMPVINNPRDFFKITGA